MDQTSVFTTLVSVEKERTTNEWLLTWLKARQEVQTHFEHVVKPMNHERQREKGIPCWPRFVVGRLVPGHYGCGCHVTVCRYHIGVALWLIKQG